MTDYGTPRMTLDEQNKLMSEAYWKLWNPKEQKRIDDDIEANRKADASIKLKNVQADTEVQIEQISHDFIFGAHIFNFNQLGADERNKRYKDLYGELFNSATIPFYWKEFELEEGKSRFKEEFRDTAEYWNNVPEPKYELHWRRPATDPLVEFCECKGIRSHGHTLTWGNVNWQIPSWFMKKLPEKYRKQLPVREDCASAQNMAKFFNQFTPAQIEEMLPEYTSELNRQMAKRIIDIALYYKGRLTSWDVANESANDFGSGAMVPGDGICKSWYTLMPGDYTYRSFKIAESIFPNDVKLNINDYTMTQKYPDQVKDLIKRNCKVDIVGAQMHLFKPQECLDIAEGNPDFIDPATGKMHQSPESVRETMKRLAQPKCPIHLSEITVTSPGSDLKGEAIQAVIARNLYRLWFSIKDMMGITWWNVVDDCGAPGEPSVSGLFSRDMQAKLSYYALNDLINKEWKTNTVGKVSNKGILKFRGFRGKYKLTWVDKKNKTCSTIVELK